MKLKSVVSDYTAQHQDPDHGRERLLDDRRKNTSQVLAAMMTVMMMVALCRGQPFHQGSQGLIVQTQSPRLHGRCYAALLVSTPWDTWLYLIKVLSTADKIWNNVLEI